MIDNSVNVRVTVIGTPRPIVHPSTFEAFAAILKCTDAIRKCTEGWGPSLSEAMLALARTGGRP